MSTESDSDLIGDLLTELAVEQARVEELTSDLIVTRELLSETLTRLVALTKRCTDQTNQIRQLMGLAKSSTEWHPPIRLEEQPNVDIPDSMVRTHEIRWRAFEDDERG